MNDIYPQLKMIATKCMKVLYLKKKKNNNKNKKKRLFTQKLIHLNELIISKYLEWIS